MVFVSSRIRGHPAQCKTFECSTAHRVPRHDRARMATEVYDRLDDAKGRGRLQHTECAPRWAWAVAPTKGQCCFFERFMQRDGVESQLWQPQFSCIIPAARRCGRNLARSERGQGMRQRCCARCSTLGGCSKALEHCAWPVASLKDTLHAKFLYAGSTTEMSGPNLS